MPHNPKYNLWTKHAFVYDSHYKPLHKTEFYGVLIDNRADAPICVLENKERAGGGKYGLCPTTVL